MFFTNIFRAYNWNELIIMNNNCVKLRTQNCKPKVSPKEKTAPSGRSNYYGPKLNTIKARDFFRSCGWITKKQVKKTKIVFYSLNIYCVVIFYSLNLYLLT